MPLPIGKGGIKHYFCLSVHPSHTWRIIPEPEGLACPNLEGRFPTLDATCVPVSRSKGQGHQTHASCATSSEWQGLRTSNLVYGWRTTTRVSHRSHDLQGQRSRSQGHVISLSCLGPMLYLCRYRPTAAYRMG